MKIKFDLMFSAAEWMVILKNAAYVGCGAVATFYLDKVIDFGTSAPIVVGVLTVGLNIVVNALNFEKPTPVATVAEELPKEEKQPEQ